MLRMLIEMMNTTDASPCSAAAFFRCGRHAWVSPSAPHTLTSKILRHLPRSTASNGSNVSMRNALLTRPSSRPNASMVRSTSACTCSASTRLVGTASARPPVASISACTCGEVLGVAGREHDRGALAGERPGVGLAEARTDSRHDDDFVLQQHPPIRASRDRARRNPGGAPGVTGGHRRGPAGLKAGRRRRVDAVVGGSERPMLVTGVQAAGSKGVDRGPGRRRRHQGHDARPGSTATRRQRDRADAAAKPGDPQPVVFPRPGIPMDHRPVALRHEHAAARYRADGGDDDARRSDDAASRGSVAQNDRLRRSARARAARSARAAACRSRDRTRPGPSRRRTARRDRTTARLRTSSRASGSPPKWW